MIVAIIPAYNEAERISKVLSAVPPEIDCIIVVDDGSKDATKSIVDEAAACDRRITLLSNNKNRGVGAALRLGILYAFRQLPARVIVMLDADGEHDPNDLPRLLDRLWQDNVEVVLGQRDLSKMPIARKFSNITVAGLIRLVSGLKIHDSQCGFRAFRTSILPRLSLHGEGYEFATRFLIDVGLTRTSTSCIHIKTLHRKRRMTQYRRAAISATAVIHEILTARLHSRYLFSQHRNTPSRTR